MFTMNLLLPFEDSVSFDVHINRVCMMMYRLRHTRTYADHKDTLDDHVSCMKNVDHTCVTWISRLMQGLHMRWFCLDTWLVFVSCWGMFSLVLHELEAGLAQLTQLRTGFLTQCTHICGRHVIRARMGSVGLRLGITYAIRLFKQPWFVHVLWLFVDVQCLVVLHYHNVQVSCDMKNALYTLTCWHVQNHDLCFLFFTSQWSLWSSEMREMPHKHNACAARA